MSQEGKKISFGFSNLVKPKVSIISTSKLPKSDNSIQFIDCVEDKSIKVKNETPKEPEFLVIPLPKQDVSSGKRSDLLNKILNNSVNSEKSAEACDSLPVNNVSTNSENNVKVETLDEIAAREIIDGLKKQKENEEVTANLSVPLVKHEATDGKETTIEEYESIPIEKFGMAMLRGMGWIPGKGIGKNEQVVVTKPPILRPKGLGLGADKVIKKDEKSHVNSEPLKLLKGTCVRVVAGSHKDKYGEIISFDDETGRVVVKMALGNSVLTFNEFMVESVSKDDFNKNSKVINVKKYEEYKKNEDSKGVIVKSDVLILSDKERRDKYNRDKIHTSRRDSSDEDIKQHSLKQKKEASKIPEKYNFNTNMYKNSSKSNYRSSSSPEQRHSSKYEGHKSYRDHREHKNYMPMPQEITYSKSRHDKPLTKRDSSLSSDESSSSECYSHKSRDSNHRTRINLNSSDSSSDEHYKKRKDYKKKCKKNKEKKEYKRQGSYSFGKKRKKRSPSPKKHKRSK